MIHRFKAELQRRVSPTSPFRADNVATINRMFGLLARTEGERQRLAADARLIAQQRRAALVNRVRGELAHELAATAERCC